jgi:dTDP-glucose 4,6-dehydratase
MDNDLWQDRPVLVTGAGGFIGSHLVERLASAGARVRAFVRYNSRNDCGWIDTLPADTLSQVEVFRGDLANPEAVSSAVAGCTTVFHLGALIPIPYSYRHPREFVTANVVGTLNVLEAARRHGPERVVHVSTSEVYGTPKVVPISEQHPLRAQSPYAASKLGADQLALSYQASFSTPLVIARPFNTFGPRQSARAVIPTIVTQALANGEIHIGTTKTTRDFLYVGDTVAGMLRCAEADGVEGEVFNFGSGHETSIGELIERVLAILGRDLPVSVEEDRLRPPNSEVERLLADWSKAKTRLAWQPEVELDDGLRRTIDWIGDSLHTYKPSLYNI